MIWLLGGYMWLFVHRPFEVWPVLGSLQIERAYMLVMLLVWAVTPGKRMLPNRVHAALAGVALALTVGWLLSPYGSLPGIAEVVAPNGTALTVTGRTDMDQAKIRGLGFFGLLTEGVHHELHHMMLAKGEPMNH